jgi:hypothetical protein
MAKKKQKLQDSTDRLSELLELAQELKMPEDALNGDIEDAADTAAEIMAENVKSGTMLGKLEFLWSHGFQPGRLEELIREYAETGGNP